MWWSKSERKHLVLKTAQQGKQVFYILCLLLNQTANWAQRRKPASVKPTGPFPLIPVFLRLGRVCERSALSSHHVFLYDTYMQHFRLSSPKQTSLMKSLCGEPFTTHKRLFHFKVTKAQEAPRKCGLFFFWPYDTFS